MAVLIGISIREPGREAAARAVLSRERLQKADRLAQPDDRLRCLCAGLALDAALRTVGLRERELTLSYNDHGKPAAADHPSLHFSLSHSGDWAVCALDRRPIGVDVEQRRAVDVLRLAGRYFAPEETALLAGLAGEQQLDTFFRLWTAKESVLKAEGSGLSRSPAAVPVVVGTGLTPADSRYRLTEYALEGYRLTVCSAGAPPAALQVITGGTDYETHCTI